MEPKTYIGVKKVMAQPITLTEFINKTGRNPYADNPNPAKDLKKGYAVTYEDGYIGYSPKSVFEASYREIDDLNINCIDVISPDYKKRFEAEYYALKERIKRLTNMMAKWDANELNFTPTCPKYIFIDQLHYMKGYLRVLEHRALIEKIELNTK